MAPKASGVSIAIRGLVILGLIAGGAECLNLIAGSQLTNREAALLGLLLAILSVLASWIITHMYSESQSANLIKDVQEQHRANLKTYALKAAEKVNNLSNELNKLSLYLDEELSYTDYPNAEAELSSKEERIESAIHITKR